MRLRGRHGYRGRLATGAKPGRGFGAALLLPLLLLGAGASAIAARHTAQELGLPRVTIHASKERVRRQVDQFVAAVLVQPWGETLMRWNQPVCPLVAGLPVAYGEFILRRISQAALHARAPLAGKVCRPNLYVVATDDPDLLLKKWWSRNPGMYDTRHGLGGVRRFLESKRTVRVWYNAVLGCGDGGPVIPGRSMLSIAQVEVLGGGSSTFAPGAPTCTSGIDTHLSYGDTESLLSVIVVLDLRRLKPMTIQQLADYIAMVSLADLRVDPDPGAAPSILRLFSAHAAPPPGLTQWDRALLHSLYNTRQQDKRQVQDMEEAMVRRIAPVTSAPPRPSRPTGR